MKTTNSGGVLLLGCLAGASAIGIWHYLTQPPLAHVLVSPDVSLSVERNCPGFGAATKALLSAEGVRTGSTLTLLAMGRAPRDPDPELRFTVAIPIRSDSVMGRSKAQTQYEQDIGKVLDTLQQGCGAIEDAQHTPLYELVRQGLAHLHSESVGCKPDGMCYFLIKTDLIEDIDPVLTALLHEAAKDPQAPTPPELAGTLDNSGVAIVVCGTSEVLPPRKGSVLPPLGARQRIWNDLFTHAELVTYQPFCN